MPTMNTVLRGLHYLNERHVARILVCAAPGVLLNKLAVAADAPQAIKMASVAVLGVGVLLYVSWNFVYSRVLGVDDEEEIEGAAESGLAQQSSPVIPGQVHVDLLKELVTMCGTDAQAALTLVETELIVSPNISYPAAIELAHRRKDFEIKSRSGS